MEKITIVVSIIGIIGTISSIYFAYKAVNKNKLTEEKDNAKHEQIIISDIGYIKACVNRVEKNLNIVDERYRDCVERIAKIEVSLTNITKRVDDIYKVEGG